MEQRLSLVTLGVDDIQRAKDFYAAMGWKPQPPVEGEDNVVFYQLNGLALGFYPRALLIEDAGLPAETKSGFGGLTLAFNTRSKEEVETVIGEARAAGAIILKEPQDVFWGGYHAYFQDPDGHIWEVAWNPYFPIDDEGNLSLS